MLAHVLAAVAVKRGSSRGLWIGAATLDRYLQRIKREQIFGTQYQGPAKEVAGGKWTQDPYDREMISDVLRAEFGVPPQAEQNERLRYWEEFYKPKK